VEPRRLKKPPPLWPEFPNLPDQPEYESGEDTLLKNKCFVMKAFYLQSPYYLSRTPRGMTPIEPLSNYIPMKHKMFPEELIEIKKKKRTLGKMIFFLIL
jgi:hypothetical protein